VFGVVSLLSVPFFLFSCFCSENVLDLLRNFVVLLFILYFWIEERHVRADKKWVVWR